VGEKYAEEREFIGINTVLYGVVLNALKADLHFKEIKEIVEKFDRENVNWKNNKYLPEMGLFRKLYVGLVNMRLWTMLWLLSKITILYEK
jgi:hypothetical protein